MWHIILPSCIKFPWDPIYPLLIWKSASYPCSSDMQLLLFSSCLELALAHAQGHRSVWQGAVVRFSWHAGTHACEHLFINRKEPCGSQCFRNFRNFSNFRNKRRKLYCFEKSRMFRTFRKLINVGSIRYVINFENFRHFANVSFYKFRNWMNVRNFRNCRTFETLEFLWMFEALET